MFSNPRLSRDFSITFRNFDDKIPPSCIEITLFESFKIIDKKWKPGETLPQRSRMDFNCNQNLCIENSSIENSCIQSSWQWSGQIWNYSTSLPSTVVSLANNQKKMKLPKNYRTTVLRGKYNVFRSVNKIGKGSRFVVKWKREFSRVNGTHLFISRFDRAVEKHLVQ